MCTRAHKSCSGLRRQRGAALLILLTMLILGVAAVGMNAFGGSARTSRERQALAAVGEAKEALLGYASTHGRLPRPALSADSGVEDPTPCASEQRCTGFLPWATLSLGPTYARGKPLRYSVTPAFADPNPQLSTAVATKTISNRIGKQLVFLQGSANCARQDQCVPAVVISSGKYQGLSSLGATDQASNDAANVHFIQRPQENDETAVGAAFDDIVAWLPYGLLKTRMAVTDTWH
jgi:type II secretory pathway pseudopilin PulG